LPRPHEVPASHWRSRPLLPIPQGTSAHPGAASSKVRRCLMKLRDSYRLVVPPALALFVAVASAQAGGDARAKVKPFPEAKALKTSVKELEAYWIPLGKLTGDGQAEKYQVVEGKWTHVTYSNPAKRSVIEIGRVYDQQLRDAGFEIVYDCRNGDCGQGGRKTNGDWWDPN